MAKKAPYKFKDGGAFYPHGFPLGFYRPGVMEGVSGRKDELVAAPDDLIATTPHAQRWLDFALKHYEANTKEADFRAAYQAEMVEIGSPLPGARP